MVQLHQLAYALAVAEEKSFTQAAARLHLAQPSLSRQVRLLEDELGVLLFNRGPGQGPVTLTPDGAALVPFMQRVLADVAATGAEARALSGMARGRLAVGATPSLITERAGPRRWWPSTPATRASTCRWWRPARTSWCPRWRRARSTWPWSCCR